MQVDNSCFEAYIWHDGEFPFEGDSGTPPVHIHHCDADQFIEFGKFVAKLIEEDEKAND